MEESYLEEIDTGGLEEFVSRDEDPGIFPEKTQQIAIIRNRNLLKANEVIIIIEIVIQK